VEAAELIENKQSISKTIFRYIFFEMLLSFTIAFLFFFLMFFVNQILLMAREVLTKHVPFPFVMLLVLFSLPTVIAQSAPFACLVGTLMTVGRLTSDNEILVMLSSGLSYKIVFSPAVVLGIIISLMSFFVNDVLLPAGNIQFNKLWRQILLTIPSLELESNSVKRFQNTVIVTGNVSGNVIDDLLILDRTAEGERRLIMASGAELKDNGKEGLSLELKEAFFHLSKEIVLEDYDYAQTSLLQYRVTNEEIMQTAVSISAREMSSRDVYSEIKEKEAAVAVRTNNRKTRLAVQAQSLENVLRAGTEEYLWNTRLSNITSLNRELNLLNLTKNDYSLTVFIIEFHRKFVVPFGTFCFVFLAVSLGLMARKSGQVVGFIFGIIIAVIYWSMLFIFIGQLMGLHTGTPPFWLMWFPNIISLSAGIILALIRIRK
jgi:lipopolysaccharide export system permease protein